MSHPTITFHYQHRTQDKLFMRISDVYTINVFDVLLNWPEIKLSLNTISAGLRFQLFLFYHYFSLSKNNVA